MTSHIDTYEIQRQLRATERQRDHMRALLADAELSAELKKIPGDWWDNKEERAADLSAKIAKRATRRAKEMATYGTYIRPGPWDDDLDNYQEASYTTDVGDEYRIRINRVYDGTWNGYVVLPVTHPSTGKPYDSFNGRGADRAPQYLTYGGPGSEHGVYGFYFGSCVKPYPSYGIYSKDHFYSFEKSEYGSHINYEDMYKCCLELVTYFKGLAVSSSTA